MMTMKMGRGFAVGLILLFGGPAIAAEPDEAESLVAKLKASLGAIETLQGTYRNYFSPKTPGTVSIEPDGHPVPGAIAGPDGQILYSEFDWAWQAAPYREAIDGKWGFVDKNQMHYTTAAISFDGAILRTFNRDAKGGLIKPLDNTFTVWRNPLRLIGEGFGYEPRRNLDTLLSGARLVSLPDTPPHLKVLKGEYRDYGDQDFELTVWIDTTHGHLPRRIEVLEKARRFVTSRILNEDISEVAPGVWVALRGSETGYYVDDFELADGMTKDQLKTLGRKAIVAILAKSRAITKPLGLGTQTSILDAQTLRLNRTIPRERFVLNYPEGTNLYDTTHEPPLPYKFKANRTPEEWREIVAKGKQRADAEKKRQAVQQALIGTPAVEFPADSGWINSKPLKLADLAGKVVLLDFWAEWCGPCRNDLPGLAELHRTREEIGITVIGIHPTGSDRAAVDKVIQEFHLDYPIVIDVPAPEGVDAWGRLYGRYAVNAIPHAILIDRRGQVVASGELSDVFARARQITAEGQGARE